MAVKVRVVDVPIEASQPVLPHHRAVTPLVIYVTIKQAYGRPSSLLVVVLSSSSSLSCPVFCDMDCSINLVIISLTRGHATVFYLSEATAAAAAARATGRSGHSRWCIVGKK